MSRVTIRDKTQFREAVLALQKEVMHSQRLSRADAQAWLLEKLGISTASRPTLLDVWTQPSRLKTLSTIEDQYLYGLAWLGFHQLSRNPEWLEQLLRSTGTELEYPLVNSTNRPVLRGLFRNARLNDRRLSDDDIEQTLDTIFNRGIETLSPPAPPDDGAYGFQINRIHTDAANHLYVELCGVTRTPLIFAVRNERTGYTWQSLGSRLEGPCKLYRAIWDISSGNTWYAIDIVCHDGQYGAHVRVLTSATKPYFCADVRIEGPEPDFERRIELD